MGERNKVAGKVYQVALSEVIAQDAVGLFQPVYLRLADGSFGHLYRFITSAANSTHGFGRLIYHLVCPA